MSLPARRQRNSGKQNDGKRFPRHLQHVRGYECAIAGRRGHVCDGKVVPAHVDYAGGKGMSLKVSDAYTVPLCWAAHAEQTDVLGWGPFERKYGIDALKIAKAIARQSPAIIEAARLAGHDIGAGCEE